MSRVGPVFVHLGLPKTGTTYLQTILWEHVAQLRAAGLLLPGRRREHLWASCDLREQAHLERRHPDAPGSWARLVAELGEWSGAGLISHEFFAAASAEQVARLVADLGGASPGGPADRSGGRSADRPGDSSSDTLPREVHVIVTVREIVAQVTAMWQEWIKNGASGPIDAYPVGPSRPPYPPGADWGWATLDLGDVLARWGTHVPPERIHVICPPGPGQARDLLWHRFADVLGLPLGVVDPAGASAYASLGLAQVELLRRVNPRLEGFTRAVDRGAWIRGHLAMRTLAPLGSEPFRPSPERTARLRARGERSLALVEAGGYHVVGGLDVVRTPAGETGAGAQVRHPEQATDAELLDAASATIAALLGDVRAERERRVAAEARADGSRTSASRTRRGLRRVRSAWQSAGKHPTDSYR